MRAQRGRAAAGAAAEVDVAVDLVGLAGGYRCPRAECKPSTFWVTSGKRAPERLLEAHEARGGGGVGLGAAADAAPVEVTSANLLGHALERLLRGHLRGVVVARAHLPEAPPARGTWGCRVSAEMAGRRM
jgi:hypothetical protein